MRTAWQDRMIPAGVALILAGFLFGLVFSLSVEHQARLVAHDAYRPVFEELAGNRSSEEWHALEATIRASSVAHRRAADTHGHSINMGILLILVGVLAPLFTAAGDRLAALFILSAVTYPGGLLLQFLSFTATGEIVAAIGALGAIVSLAMLYARVWRTVGNSIAG